MLRKRVDARWRAARPRRGRRVAPAPLRVLAIMAIVGPLAAIVGGPDGFWLGVPGAVLAGSIASSGLGMLCCAAPVLLLDAGLASAAGRGPLPHLWVATLVPAACLLVLHGMGRRLRRERDLMEHAAYSDSLTGLANRRLLMSVAEHEIARHHRAATRFTVVMLDLDGFKLLNDRYGHAAGDRMLRDVGGALTGALRSQDTIARLGGDEFCVIAPETAEPRPLAEKIVAAVSEVTGGYESLQASVGGAVFPEDGTTVEALLRAADARLLGAKRRRHGSPHRRVA